MAAKVVDITKHRLNKLMNQRKALSDDLLIVQMAEIMIKLIDLLIAINPKLDSDHYITDQISEVASQIEALCKAQG